MSIALYIYVAVGLVLVLFAFGLLTVAIGHVTSPCVIQVSDDRKSFTCDGKTLQLSDVDSVRNWGNWHRYGGGTQFNPAYVLSLRNERPIRVVASRRQAFAACEQIEQIRAARISGRLIERIAAGIRVRTGPISWETDKITVDGRQEALMPTGYAIRDSSVRIVGDGEDVVLSLGRLDDPAVILELVIHFYGAT